jgi:hypothetical protein
MPRRDEFALNALADTLVVDLEAGMPHASTTIEYAKHRDWVLMHRIRGDDWIGVPVPIVDLDDPHLTRGDFETFPLKPGQLYEACIVPPDFEPDPDEPVHELVVRYDTDDRGPPPSVSVVALRKQREPRDFYSDGNSRTYGTYHERDVIATTDVVAQLSVSTSPWVDAGGGFIAVPDPKQVVARGPKQTFSFRVEDLLPGTPHHEVLLLVDEFGNWQFVTDTITTRKRKIEAEVTELFVIDDDDDFSNGEGTFWFTVQSGDPLLAESNALSYDNDNLESGQVAVPTPSGTCILGPSPVIPATKRVFFSAGGISDNSGSAEGNDIATGRKELSLPVGPGENVQSETDSFEMSGAELSVRVTYEYSVGYQ